MFGIVRISHQNRANKRRQVETGRSSSGAECWHVVGTRWRVRTDSRSSGAELSSSDQHASGVDGWRTTCLFIGPAALTSTTNTQKCLSSLPGASLSVLSRCLYTTHCSRRCLPWRKMCLWRRGDFPNCQHGDRCRSLCPTTTKRSFHLKTRCLLERIPGLFCVRGMFKIFVGKNCRICQLYCCFHLSLCSKTRQRDLQNCPQHPKRDVSKGDTVWWPLQNCMFLGGQRDIKRWTWVWSRNLQICGVGGIWSTFLNSWGGNSTPEIVVPSPTAGSKVLELSQKHHTSKWCVFTEFQASTFASMSTTFTSKRCRRRRKRRRTASTLTTSSTSQDEFTTADPFTVQTQYHKHKILSHQVYQNVCWVDFQRSVKKHVESLHCLIYLGFARVCRHFFRAHQCKPV